MSTCSSSLEGFLCLPEPGRPVHRTVRNAAEPCSLLCSWNSLQPVTVEWRDEHPRSLLLGGVTVSWSSAAGLSPSGPWGHLLVHSPCTGFLPFQSLFPHSPRVLPGIASQMSCLHSNLCLRVCFWGTQLTKTDNSLWLSHFGWNAL